MSPTETEKSMAYGTQEADLSPNVPRIVPPNVPLFVERERADRWIAEAQNKGEAPPLDWCGDLVEERLIFAIRLVQRTAGRTGPRGFANSMPPVLREWGDLIGVEAEPANDGKRVYLSATPRQVTLADAALSWAPHYLAAHPNELAAINLWLLAKAVRRPWQAMAKKRGIAVPTAKDRKARALSYIVQGLIKDGVPPEGAGR